MERIFRSILEMLDRAIDAIGGLIREGTDQVVVFDPNTWTPGFLVLVLALVGLLLLATLRRRTRRPLEVREPELLVTRGELVPSSGPGRGAAGLLTMSVSNLSRYPVQVLEVAVHTGPGKGFGVAEASALVPAMGDADVTVRLPLDRFEDGVLDVYAYAAATRTKTYRHRAELVWEPWAKRFKVAPLEQSTRPARTLASTHREARTLPARAATLADARGAPLAPAAAIGTGLRRGGTPSTRNDRPERAAAEDAGGGQAAGPAGLFAMLGGGERPQPRRTTGGDPVRPARSPAVGSAAEATPVEPPAPAVVRAASSSRSRPAPSPADAAGAAAPAEAPKTGVDARATRRWRELAAQAGEGVAAALRPRDGDPEDEEPSAPKRERPKRPLEFPEEF
jgi:hypothetical protein